MAGEPGQRVAVEHLADPLVARVLLAHDALEPAPRVARIELADHRVDQLLDVAPVLVAVEESLEDEQILGGEQVDRVAVSEGHALASLAAALVEDVVGEEEIDGCRFPVDAHLLVALEPRALHVARGVRAQRRQQAQHLVGAVRGDEDVHVDADGRPGRGVLGEGDGPFDSSAAVRMPDSAGGCLPVEFGCGRTREERRRR